MTIPTKPESSKTAQKAARRTSLVGALTNITLVLIKGFGGWASGSQALIADAIHSLADLLTDIIAVIAVALGRAEADESHPYGHGKFETFGTLVLSLFLFATALGIGWQMLENLRSGNLGSDISRLALFAAGLSILLNEILFRYCLFEGTKVNSKTIIANAWHHRADGLSSIAVFIGIGLSLMGFPYGDFLATGVVTLFLIHIAYKFGKDAFDELVDTAIPEEERAIMSRTVSQSEGVVNCHTLRGRRLGGDTVLDAYVEVDPLISMSEGHRITEIVEYNIKKKHPAVSDVTVHIEPIGHTHDLSESAVSPSREEMEALIRATVSEICPKADICSVTLHFVDGKTHAEIIFNKFPCDVPKKEALKKALLEKKTPFNEVSLLQKL